MNLVDELEAVLLDLKRRGLLREPAAASAGSDARLDVSSNDYLGYGRRDVSRETLSRVTVGAGASRLIFGTRAVHSALEGELAEWVGTEAALVFSSGYAANVGVLSALARPGDLIVSDALNHASLIDGCRLSRARVAVVPHLDLDAVGRALAEPAERRRWVVSETYFSMDGDSPDLGGLRALCDRTGASLILDEAHALGVFGAAGGGLAAAAGVQADCLVGTFGKAVGAQGAFAAGRTAVIRYLWNRARSFVFSTATSPVLTALALDHVRAVRRDDASRARLRSVVAALEAELEPVRDHLPAGRHGPIFPVVVGSPERAVEAAALLAARGFQAQPIRPPTVPPDACRLRITVNATMTDAQVVSLGGALREICGP